MKTEPVLESKTSAPAQAPDRAVEAGRGALFIGFAKVFFMISGFLQKVLLPHIVSVADYGAFDVVNNAVGVLNNTIVQGTIGSVSKFTAEDDERADAVKRAGLKLQLVLGTAVGVALVLAAPAIAAFYKQPSYTKWFRLVAAIPVLYSFYAVFVGSANGLRWFRTQATFDVAFSTMKTVLLLALAAVAGVTGAFAGFVVAAALILLFAARTMGLPKGKGTSAAHAGKAASFPVARLATFMGGMVAYTLLINVALSYDSLLLRRFAATAAAGQADEIAAYYGAVRALALLPYQALLVVTFVIFPLASRATFRDDKNATAAYVTQTLRYALILAVFMAVVLAARPTAILKLLYKPEYAAGAGALPVLVAGICALALLGVAGAIINASGRPRVAVALVAITVLVGGALAFALVPNAAPGPDMLFAAAVATSGGMGAGFIAALLYVRRRFHAGPPLATVLRTLAAATLALALGRVLPPSGKLVTLLSLGLVASVFMTALVVLREFGATDRAKFRKILRR